MECRRCLREFSCGLSLLLHRMLTLGKCTGIDISCVCVSCPELKPTIRPGVCCLPRRNRNIQVVSHRIVFATPGTYTLEMQHYELVERNAGNV